MSHIIDCPTCRNKLRVPTELVGHAVQCPTCGGMFTAVATPTADDFLSARPSRGVPASVPGQAPAADAQVCPYCGRANPPGHLCCNHCGAVLEDTRPPVNAGRRPEEMEHVPGLRADWRPHRAGLVLALGIVSILLGLSVLLSVAGLVMGIATWMMGLGDLDRMRRGKMDPDGYGVTQAGWVCGIIGTCLSAVFSLCCVGYTLVALLAAAAQ